MDRPSIIRRIGRSLERDKDLPISRKIQKGFIFARSMVLAPVYLRKCNRLGRRARTRGRPYIVNVGRIHIGDDFNLNSRIVKSELATGPHGLIDIGDEVGINFGAAISSQALVKIGNRVRIGPYAMIIDSDFHTPSDRFSAPTGKAIIIEDDVWLGGRVTVLKGTTIGRGAVITAGSVVSGTIPPFVIAGGVPARILRELHPAVEMEPREKPQCDEKIQTEAAANRTTEVFKKVFSVDGAVDLSWGPRDIERWDSLGHLNLILGIEKEFNIALQEDDMLHMNTVEDVCRVVQKYIKVNSGQDGTEARNDLE
jgi:acetyltransferase-like isoleucine patch superfamily enzyme/acyl carrier protein